MTGSYNWATDAAHRARKQGALVISLFTREEVFERDGYLCHLCGLQTDSAADPYDPNSPTIDHLVPLSLGGEHSTRNVACAHLRCNSRRKNAPLKTLGGTP